MDGFFLKHMTLTSWGAYNIGCSHIKNRPLGSPFNGGINIVPSFSEMEEVRQG